ncbi:RNA methyltransferase [Thiovibrio sp. JS02]
MNPQNISIVLVEPQGAANIGSVARVMKNFGLAELRLVQPRADYLGKEATNMAVSAVDLLRQARLYGDLAGALADRNLSVGSTRRFGKYREECVPPAEAAATVAALPKSARIAFVFGREDTGLKTAELDLCQRLISIPTHPDLPSMNLAQAVTICLYELFLKGAGQSSTARKERLTVSGKPLRAMYDHMRQTLLDADFLDPQNPEHLMRTFRRIFDRHGLNEREVRVIRGLMSRIDWLLAHARGVAGKDRG